LPRAIDLFIDSDRPLDRLADELCHLTGLPFTPSPDRSRYVMQDGPVVAHLSGHDFLDDEGLPLSEFRYVLSTAIAYGADLEASAELAALRRVSACAREADALACLLVIDLERPDLLQVPGPEGRPAGEANG
jgi:hypothetical protein